MQKKKQNTGAITISKLSTALLTSSLLVLSSIAAAQLLGAIGNNNAAFAAIKCDYVDNGQTIEQECTGGQGGNYLDPDAPGGFGGHSTCTTDLSTFENTCTGTLGHGGNSESFTGGSGSRATSTYDYPHQSITANGGGGGIEESGLIGGTGGRTTCTADYSVSGDFDCSDSVGGSGIHQR